MFTKVSKNCNKLAKKHVYVLKSVKITAFTNFMHSFII